MKLCKVNDAEPVKQIAPLAVLAAICSTTFDKPLIRHTFAEKLHIKMPHDT